MSRLNWLLAIAMLAAPVLAGAAECTAASGARRVPLLELYTSEGCDSCPPADRWVSGLPARGLTPDRIVALAFHVDYWNHLGWTDPYAKSTYSERQRAVASRKAARFVYTPQLVLDGKEYRRGLMRDDIAERVAEINRDAPPASIRIALAAHGDGPLAANVETTVRPVARRAGTSAFVALYENRLATQVRAGENRGRRLEHDFVVRELAGPFPVDAQGHAQFEHRFALDRSWNRERLNVAAFAQDGATGDVLQALALAVCPAR